MAAASRRASKWSIPDAARVASGRCLREYFPETSVSGGASGLHLVWRLSNSLPPASAIQKLARAEGIGVYTLSSGAAICFDANASDDILLLGYPSVSEDDITLAVTRLRTLVDQLQKDGVQERVDQMSVA